MRKISAQPLADAKWRRWTMACSDETAKLLEQVARGAKPAITKLYKRKSIKDAYFFGKGPPFYGKCAYCETYIPDYQHGDVEHFRPKAGVTDEHGEVVHLRNVTDEPELDGEGQLVPHPGYYWLAYDWQNLLPSCIKCNQPGDTGEGKIGKHSRFPVKGRHAQTPEEVEDEEALLIHPASGRSQDDPALHLAVDTETGVLSPLADSERGAMCIEVFGLNVRDQLLADRKRACDQVRALLIRIILQPRGDATAMQELLEITAGRRSFTMAQVAVLAEAKQSWTRILPDAPGNSP